MEQMLMKRKNQLKSKKNVIPNNHSQEKQQIRADDPFQGLTSTDLNLNQVPRSDHNTAPQYSRGIKYSTGVSNDSVAMKSSDKEIWVRQQERAFTGWVNAHLQTRQMHIDSLQQDIATVTPLIHLLEVLEKKPLKEITKYHKKPRHKFDRLDGFRICLKQIRSRGKKNIKVGFDAEELLKGEKKKQYLALIWRIIVNYAIEDTTAEEIVDNKKRAFRTPEARLRWWCNTRLPDELKVANFTKDWSDGKVLVSLMNQALDENDRVTAEDIEDMDTEELLEGLLKLGDKHLHIPQLLDAYEMMHSPNKEAMMTYVSLLRTAIEAKESERSAAAASMKKMKDAFTNLEDNWLNRVKVLEGRLEEAEKGQADYAEKLQEERLINAKQLHDAKDKTDKLFEQIEKLKALCLDQQHEKEMLEQDYQNKIKQQHQEITRLKQQILQLQANNDILNEQLKEVLSKANQASTGNTQQKQAYEMQIANIQSSANQEKKQYENRVSELEKLMEAQRKKFNDFYEQYKKKLESSNKAGREFREKCIVVAADTEALRKRIAELEALLKQKEKELLDARKREKELLEQLATQETVFRIQLQELGQFIKEMKQREQVREKQQVEAYHKLLKEREARIAKDKERKKKQHLQKRASKNGAAAMNNVDIEAQRKALMQFERRKSQGNYNDGGGGGHQPPPPSGPPPASKNFNPLLADAKPAGNGQKPAFDKQTESVRTKFGNEKLITTWFYTGRDKQIHEVILRHNTKHGKDGKSKRVIVVDGKVRYAEKSKETHFIIKNGRDQLKLNISNSNKKQPSYQLFINDISFSNLQNQYIAKIASR